MNSKDSNPGDSLHGIVRNFHSMEHAPKDGTEVRLLIRHPNWMLAHAHGNQDDWQQEVTGKWIDHNGGGWTWHGMAGEPVGFYIPNVPRQVSLAGGAGGLHGSGAKALGLLFCQQALCLSGEMSNRCSSKLLTASD